MSNKNTAFLSEAEFSATDNAIYQFHWIIQVHYIKKF